MWVSFQFCNMKSKHLLLSLILILFIITCSTKKTLVYSNVRQLKPNDVTSYHDPIHLTIAWYPYENQQLEKTSKNEWTIVKSDSNKTGNMPVILIEYPLSRDSIWLDMNTESEMLGKLLKHSLMTQEPIRRPFNDFFQSASCTKCHPSDLKVDFDN